ncbi:MAG: OmpA family protein [Cyclobacteriaceae bacterium]|nr:OmpA family protein [Cyclobacteriaceae bacterium]
MRKVLIVLMVSWVVAAAAFAQADTTIYAVGKIVSAVTKEPVTAKITYQSLPYGSKVGLLQGSTFSFPLYDNEKYELTVEASGFARARYMIDPAEANADRKVVRDIELTIPQSAMGHAETVHTVGKVMRLDNLIFEVGKSKIDPTSYSELDEVVQMMRNNPKMVIQLEGHTDVRGDPRKNMELSQQRVTAVRDYLIKKGVHKGKVRTKAFGGTQPISRENTEEAHKLNRRVEVRILEN